MCYTVQIQDMWYCTAQLYLYLIGTTRVMTSDCENNSISQNIQLLVIVFTSDDNTVVFNLLIIFCNILIIINYQ